MPDYNPYACTELENELRQAEILTGVMQYYYNIVEDRIDRTTKPFVVVLSQDCDLLQDYNSRQQGKPAGLNGVLLYEAQTVGTMKAGGMERRVFDRIAQNSSDRYHFLQSVDAGSDSLKEGIPELIIDFKRYFTVSITDLHWQLLLENGPKRRTRLSSPYLEHLQCRAASYMSRIGLPVPHQPSATSFQAAQLPAPADAVAVGGS